MIIANNGEWTNVAAGGGAIWYLESPGKLVAVDPSRSEVTRVIRLSAARGRAAFEFAGASFQGTCVSQIAPTSRAGLLCLPRTAKRVIRISAGPGPIAGAPDGSLWVGGPSLTQLTLTPRKTKSIPLPRKTSVDAVAARGDSVWVAVNFSSRTSAKAQLWQLKRGKVVHRFPVPGAWVAAVAPARGRVWLLTEPRRGKMAEIKVISRSGRLRSVSRVARTSRVLVAAPSSVWTLDYRSGTATVITVRR